MMLNLVRPEFFLPVHGEYRHLVQHARLAQEVGVPSEKIFIAEIGDVLEVAPGYAAITGRVPAGRVFVDGLGVGDVGNIVLRDRKQLAQDGILIVVITMDKDNNQILAGPDIVSRGFVYVRESEDLLAEARQKVLAILLKSLKEGSYDWTEVKTEIRENLGRFFYEKIKRRPMLLPIIMEV
jgi:ribonuclease J